MVAILDHNKSGLVRINSVAVPGLCTGVGGMAADEAAPQIRTVYDLDYVHKNRHEIAANALPEADDISKLLVVKPGDAG